MKLDIAIMLMPHIISKLKAEGVDIKNKEDAINALLPCVLGKTLVKAYIVLFCDNKNI